MTIHEAELEHPRKAFGWAARDPSDVLSPFNFSSRERGEKDVSFKVLFCGICHSDLHMIRNELGMSTYPLVPGHEIVGVVTEVGSKVGKFKVGDRVGMGGMAGSCRSCQECSDHLEMHCSKLIFTCSGKNVDGTTTYGGFSDSMVADEHFVFHIPDSLSLHATAPLFCAGITVYSPLRYFGLDKSGLNIGVVGLGGLGHMAVKFAKAFGARVTVISTSPSKKEEAIEHLGANSFLISHEQDQMQAENGTFDGIIDTVPVVHPLLPLLNLLKTRGKLRDKLSVLVLGTSTESGSLQLPVIPLISGKKSICGSVVGGVKEIEEMLEFAAKHKIEADVEVIPMSYVNTAMERLLKADIRYAFVIDILNTLKP